MFRSVNFTGLFVCYCKVLFPWIISTMSNSHDALIPSAQQNTVLLLDHSAGNIGERKTGN
jgi:hypothetical protein